MLLREKLMTPALLNGVSEEENMRTAQITTGKRLWPNKTIGLQHLWWWSQWDKFGRRGWKHRNENRTMKPRRYVTDDITTRRRDVKKNSETTQNKRKTITVKPNPRERNKSNETQAGRKTLWQHRNEHIQWNGKRRKQTEIMTRRPKQQENQSIDTMRWTKNHTTNMKTLLITSRQQKHWRP